LTNTLQARHVQRIISEFERAVHGDLIVSGAAAIAPLLAGDPGPDRADGGRR
jgi:hypothetical protein